MDMSKMSSLERKLYLQILAVCQEKQLPEPEAEHRFDHERKWRFDFAWPDWRIAVEAEGGQWTGGRHYTGAGFEKDCEKYNEAVAQGWDVLRFTTNMINDGRAMRMIERMIPLY